MKYKLIIALIAISIFFPTVHSIPSGGSCQHLSNPSPTQDAENISVHGNNSVQTCIDITIDQGCVANVTFQWFNWSGFYQAWQDYLDGGALPNYNDYEHNYSSWSLLNQSQTLCAWNHNVSCYTNGSIPYFSWRVIANFTCTQSNYEEICYYEFYPEECELFYIYPPNNATNICGCCDCISIGINNEEGHNMNLTVFMREENGKFEPTWYTQTQFLNESNGTYSFCPEGFITDVHAVGHIAEPIYPTVINTWYNITFGNFHSFGMSGTPSEVTIPIDGHYTLWYSVSAETSDSNPVGNNMGLRMAQNGAEINGSYREINFQKQDNLREITSFVHTKLEQNDLINFQYIVNDIDIYINEDNTWAEYNTSAYAMIQLNEPLQFALKYNTTYEWYIQITDAETGKQNDSDTFFFTTEPNPDNCPCGEEDLTALMEDTDTIRDDTWILGIAMIFTALPLAVALKGRKKKKKRKVDDTYPMQFRRKE